MTELFKELRDAPADEITAVVAQFAADVRVEKLDLGIGIYRNERGEEQLMQAVDEAAQRVVARHLPKGYLGIRGEATFLERFAHLICGDEYANTAMVQTVGGTGAVRLAYEFAAHLTADLNVHVGTPSWANHIGIAEALGLGVVRHRYYDVELRKLNFSDILSAAQATGRGDVFVIHGPCHNPTGVDLTLDQRLEVLACLEARGALPLFDLAYYGLGQGLAQDLQQLQTQFDHAPVAMIAASCSKAFGLYQDRIGALFIKAESSASAARVQQVIENRARTLTSSSPAHGALLVAEVLSDEALTNSWQTELAAMHQRVIQVRKEMATLSRDIKAVSATIGVESGLFTLLDVTPEIVSRLAVDSAIYLPASGRINLSGLTEDAMRRLVSALEAAS